MALGFGKVSGVFAVGMLLAGCGSVSEPEHASAPPRSAPFEGTYEAAALEFEVPLDVIRAIAFAQTGHTPISAADSHSGQAGVMGLQPDIIAEAAQLLGLPAATIESDLSSNVRAAAAIVAKRRADGLSWNAAALGVANLSHASLRASWLLKFSRELKRAGSAIRFSIEEPLELSSFAPGDYPTSTFIAANSGNYSDYSRALSDVDKVIIHDVEGSYEGCISWFQNAASNVSAHYVVSNEGAITQMVREADVAWHAGNWNYNERSVGIEHEGFMSDPASYPETMYVSSAALTAYLCDKYSIPCTRTNVIAHKEVPGATHTDPGPYWKWDHYMQLVQNGGGELTATLVGYVRKDDIYNGDPIAGATVTLTNGPTVFSTITDADGYYEVANLDLAIYTVSATAPGYDPTEDIKEVENAGTWWKSLALTTSGELPTDPGDDKKNLFGCAVSTSAGLPASLAPLFLALAGLGIAMRRRRSTT